MVVQLFPVKVPVKKRPFDLFDTIRKEFAFRQDDIVIVSSKFVSVSEGRVVRLSEVVPTLEARKLAKMSGMDAKLTELVMRESTYLLRGVPGFLLTIRDGMIAPNAGIDRSNVPKGYAVLYPRQPFHSARLLRQRFRSESGIRVGVVISDSRLMPTRIGTTGVAIAVSGFEPVDDMRGRKDLFGNRLRVTQKATADGLATMGVAIMGESDESIPVVVVRGALVNWTKRILTWRDLAVSPEIDIYLSGRKDLVDISAGELYNDRLT